MWYAVYRSMRGNLQRRHTMLRLHLFPDANVPDEIMANISNQLRTGRVVPKRLDEYDGKTIEEFPKIMEYPKGYVIK